MKILPLILAIILACFFLPIIGHAQDIEKMMLDQALEQQQRQREFEQEQQKTNQQIQGLINSRGGSSMRSVGNAVLDAQRQNQQRQNETARQRNQQAVDAHTPSNQSRHRYTLDELAAGMSSTAKPGSSSAPAPSQPPDSTKKSAGFSTENMNEYYKNNPAVTSNSRTVRSTVDLGKFDASGKEGLVVSEPDEEPEDQYEFCPCRGGDEIVYGVTCLGGGNSYPAGQFPWTPACTQYLPVGAGN